MELNIPLMSNNITQEDRKELIAFLSRDEILTQSKNVVEFEREWSNWLGVRYSVFVNSGASANMLTMKALQIHRGVGEVIVPTLTWVSDIASVLQAGLTPVFVDIDPRTLAMDENQAIAKINANTRAVFLTHILGLNGLSQNLLDVLQKKQIPLIEDVCESHGATFQNKRLGSYGLVSNFSYYYAHHMSTIEGGMICTNDEKFYQTFRMLRSHGMVREATSPELKSHYATEYSDLNPDFIFAYPAYNVRSTEINAVLGRHQLKRLDTNNEKRVRNFALFLSLLDSKKYRTDFACEGAVNYAFILVLKDADERFRDRVTQSLREAKVEFRRGTSGGGNQLRQPYLRQLLGHDNYAQIPKNFPVVDHVHFFGFYIGNYPDLPEDKIRGLCALLNKVAAE